MIKKENFKKRLAFVSSLALIAGTAVYMPANVSEIIGIGKTVSVDAVAPSDTPLAPGFVYDNDKEVVLSGVVDGNGTAEKPYVYEVKEIHAEYGSTMDYSFGAVSDLSVVSGSKGTVTFDSADGSATTGVFKAYNRNDDKYVYYQVKFIQSAYLSTEMCGGNVDFKNPKFNISYVKNNGKEAYNNGYISNFCRFENNIEVIDGKYVRNYDVHVAANVKAKSKVTFALSNFINGYGTGLADDKIEVTLDENGNASKIVKFSSDWEGQNIVEYIKFNFYIGRFDHCEFEKNGNILGNDSYSISIVTENDRYIMIYTIRDTSENGEKLTIDTKDGYRDLIADGEEYSPDKTTRELEINDNTSKIMNLCDSLDCGNMYIKVVFDPTYTLTFYDNDKKTVLATQEETVGGTYTLPENPTKEGYKFAGWYLDTKYSDEKRIYGGNQIIKQADGIKAYAKWEPISYTVKIDANGGTAKTDSLTDGWSISSYGKSVQISNISYDEFKTVVMYNSGLVSRNGYEIIGFSTDKNAAVPDEKLSFLDENGDAEYGMIFLDKLTTEENSTVTLYAVWRALSKTIAFDNKNVITDTKNDSAKKTADVTFELEEAFKVNTDAKFGELPTAALKGYTFKGWYYKNDKNEWVQVTADTAASEEVIELIDKNGGLTPCFTQNMYNITCDDCGMTVVTDTYGKSTEYANDLSVVKFGFDIDGTLIRYYENGEKAEYFKYLNDEPEKGGYAFVGYTINGIVKNEFAKENKDKYFTPGEIHNFLYGRELTYNISETKTEKLSVGESDITIKALWELDDTKSIINIDYDDAVITYTNPVTGKIVKVKPTSSTYSKFPSAIKGTPGKRITYNCDIDGDGLDNITFTDYGFDVDDVECKLSKDGYVFKGWFFKNESGNEAAFINTEFTAGVTNIYAKWEAEPKLTAPADVKVSKDGVVSWTAAENASYYRVYKVYNGITKNAKTTSSPYTFQNLTEGVEHEIYVAAFDKNGNSLRSESVKFTPAKKAVLTAPANVKVDADGNVTWTAAENAAYYKVSKVVNGKTSTGKQVTDTEYTFQYLAKGAEHEIYVTAFDKDGNSVKSESVKFTPVNAPANVKVSDDGTVTWNGGEGAAYYRVYKVYNSITKNAKTTSSPYKFQSLSEGVEHEIYVVAFDKDGNQYKSESVKFTPAKKAVLTAPTNVKVDADGNVTWTAAENAAYYKVSKVVNGKTSTGKQVTDTKYTFISFNPGQNKTVYVTAFDKDGNSVKSESVTVKAVENLKVTAKGTVTFNKVDGASYYRVYKVYNGVTKNAKTTVSPYTFQSFTKGVKHDVYVKAYDSKGNEIAVSKTVTVTAE